MLGIQFDGYKIVSCSQDGTIRIWNRKTFDCCHVLHGHSGSVVSVHIDDKMLASGSSDSTIRIWNVATGKCSILRGHTGQVNKVSIFQKSKLFSCSDDSTAKLWDISTKQCLRTFSGHNGFVQSLHVSLPMMRKPLASTESKGAEPRLVTGSCDNTIKIWCIETGECIKTLFGHEKGVQCVGADTLRILSGSLDGKLNVWDLESGKCLYSLDESGRSPVNSCFLSDTTIVAGSADGVIRVFSYSIY